MIARLITATVLTAAASAVCGRAADFTDGVFFINEDWYGHQNSTVNFLRPDDPSGDYMLYRVIQEANPGMELGCTAQSGGLWHGRLYIISKQEKDPGATVTGGRITVVDAATMKILHQQAEIDPSGTRCDGRGFVGVDEHKAYISSSNGVWVFDTDSYTVTGQVTGTSNPEAGGSGAGALYRGQSGKMATAAGKVFVAHQQQGLLVIDPSTDTVTDCLSLDFVSEGAGIGSVVAGPDGMLWLSVAADCRGTGKTLAYIVRVDPATLECETVPVPDGMYPPANSWYAWTPDAFVASAKDNCLYWKGGSDRWFSGARIYRYDLDSGTFSLWADLDADGEGWKIYGCSLGVDPESGEVYASLYRDFGSTAYMVRRYRPDGSIVRDYPLIAGYWFPSIPVFASKSGEASVDDICADTPGYADVYTLSGVYVGRYPADGGITLPQSLSPGVYIARSGGTSVKIAVR